MTFRCRTREIFKVRAGKEADRGEVAEPGFPPGAGPPLAERRRRMPCVYILRSEKNGKRYVGSSHDDSSARRMAEHNAGRSRWTKSGVPWALLYEERFESYTEARRREIFLKSGQGRKQSEERWPSPV